MQVNKEDITKQLYRAYNARGIISPSGAAGISPIITVGPGAHPSHATQITGIMSLSITAGAAVTGAIGLIVPSTQPGVLVVVTDIKVYSPSLAGWAGLLDGPTAEVDYAPNQNTTCLNTQNRPSNLTGLFWGFSNAAITPAIGTQFGGGAFAAAAESGCRSTPIVLTAGFGIVVHPGTNNLSWGADIRFEVFEQTPT